MLRAMLELQDSMNRKINPDCLSAGYPFARAILVEAVEALDHYGWKWWKSHSPVVFDAQQYDLAALDIRGKLELLTAMAAVRRSNSNAAYSSEGFP
jgi:hypothetical protein